MLKLLTALQIPSDAIMPRLQEAYFDDLKLFIEIAKHEDTAMMEMIRKQAAIPDEYIQLIFEKIGDLYARPVNEKHQEWLDSLKQEMFTEDPCSLTVTNRKPYGKHSRNSRSKQSKSEKKRKKNKKKQKKSKKKKEQLALATGILQKKKLRSFAGENKEDPELEPGLPNSTKEPGGEARPAGDDCHLPAPSSARETASNAAKAEKEADDEEMADHEASKKDGEQEESDGDQISEKESSDEEEPAEVLHNKFQRTRQETELESLIRDEDTMSINHFNSLPSRLSKEFKSRNLNVGSPSHRGEASSGGPPSKNSGRTDSYQSYDSSKDKEDRIHQPEHVSPTGPQEEKKNQGEESSSSRSFPALDDSQSVEGDNPNTPGNRSLPEVSSSERLAPEASPQEELSDDYLPRGLDSDSENEQFDSEDPSYKTSSADIFQINTGDSLFKSQRQNEIDSSPNRLNEGDEQAGREEGLHEKVAVDSSSKKMKRLLKSIDEKKLPDRTVNKTSRSKLSSKPDESLPSIEFPLRKKRGRPPKLQGDQDEEPEKKRLKTKEKKPAEESPRKDKPEGSSSSSKSKNSTEIKQKQRKPSKSSKKAKKKRSKGSTESIGRDGLQLEGKEVEKTKKKIKSSQSVHQPKKKAAENDSATAELEGHDTRDEHEYTSSKKKRDKKHKKEPLNNQSSRRGENPEEEPARSRKNKNKRQRK